MKMNASLMKSIICVPPSFTTKQGFDAEPEQPANDAANK
jgi:hypothetical protein